MIISGLNKETYSKCMNWHTFYKNGKTLYDLTYDLTWTILFTQIKSNPKFKKLNDKLRKLVDKNKHVKIYPMPEYVFSAFTITRLSEVKVVFIGQDPYFNCEKYDNYYVPQAMGLSFSVPHEIKIPSSLANIYTNMIKYGHIKDEPKSGNLWHWAYQGCLMLNVSLSVEDAIKKSHTKLWEWLTNHVIQYISDNMKNIIFVMWGSDAYSKINLIDMDKHHIIISSHPSGLSANKPFRNYPAFMDFDHFGEINKILEKLGENKIMWR